MRPLHPISSKAAASFLAVTLYVLCVSSSQAAEPSSPPSAAASTVGAPPVSKPNPQAGDAEVQTGLRATADQANKLFASTEDLKHQTDNLRILPGGSATKKAPYLLTQVDELDKQRANLRAGIARIEDYKTRNPKVWSDDLENKLLEVQISERSIAQSLDGMRHYLKEKHRWYFLGL